MDKEKQLAHPYNLEGGYNSPQLPRSPLVRIVVKMMRVVGRLLSRRNVTSVGVFCLFFFILYHSSDEIPINGRDCPSNRTNPNRIPGPMPAPFELVGPFWEDLQHLFKQHEPSPPHLEKPKHDSGFPDKADYDTFFKLSDWEANRTREKHEELMNQLPEYPDQFFNNGRGVVMLAGGRYSEFAATSLGMLREVGSKLPAEVWFKDESEELPNWCAELWAEGIGCRRLVDYMDMNVLKHPYQWKIFTMFFSSFDEILFLDADSMPMKSPDFVFDSDVYKDNGAILWPDYWKHSGSPWLPYLLGLSDAKSDMLFEEKSVESGQLFWNKKTHWKSLLLATYYNYFGPDFYYTVFNNGWMGWGDKDTFPMALKATGQPYYQVPFDIVTVFVTGTVKGIGMVQGDPTNREAHDPLFMHSNIVKWSMRRMLCEEECKDMPKYVAEKKPFRLDDKAEVHDHLLHGTRIFATQQLFEKHVDPEPLMWKCIEHTACRSRVWRDETLCRRAREHLDTVFGYRFYMGSRLVTQGGELGNKVCIDGPHLDQVAQK